MAWLKITVDTSSVGIDVVCAKLGAMGYDTLEIEDADAFDAFVSHEKPYWQLVEEELTAAMKGIHRVHFYVTEEEAGVVSLVEQALSSLSTRQDMGSLRVTSHIVQEEDWMHNWKQYYKPMPIGKRILIQPEWEPLADGEDRVVFWCDPGMSFGTGTHATTRLCLEFLDNWVTKSCRVTDLGCGSGILSVVALLLGAKEAHAVDIDKQAVDVATRNGQRNNCDGLSVTCTNLLTDTHFWETLAPADIVCANLVSDLLCELAQHLADAVANGGHLIASGILEAHCPRVTEALIAQGLTVEATAMQDGWASLHMRKKQ